MKSRLSKQADEIKVYRDKVLKLQNQLIQVLLLLQPKASHEDGGNWGNGKTDGDHDKMHGNIKNFDKFIAQRLFLNEDDP